MVRDLQMFYWNRKFYVHSHISNSLEQTISNPFEDSLVSNLGREGSNKTCRKHHQRHSSNHWGVLRWIFLLLYECVFFLIFACLYVLFASSPAALEQPLRHPLVSYHGLSTLSVLCVLFHFSMFVCTISTIIFAKCLAWNVERLQYCVANCTDIVCKFFSFSFISFSWLGNTFKEWSWRLVTFQTFGSYLNSEAILDIERYVGLRNVEEQPSGHVHLGEIFKTFRIRK